MKNKKRKLVNSLFIVILLVIALVVLTVSYFKTSNFRELTFEGQAREFCRQENVESVSICNGQIVEVKSSLLGGGSAFTHRDGTQFSCPVVSPELMSPECKSIFNAKQNNQWNCVNAC